MTPSAKEIAGALAQLGNYRVLRAQELASEGANDGIGGAHILALGMRETWGRNIEGGAKLVNGTWVPQDEAHLMDVGWLQISRRWHYEALQRMSGVAAGAWSPTVSGRTAVSAGYVPQFTPATRFVIDELGESLAAAEDYGIPATERVRFAIAAHNAGIGGALHGYRNGNVDQVTAGGDYSAWVLAARRLVLDWLHAHPSWHYQAQ